jgi:ribonuclease HII
MQQHSGLIIGVDEVGYGAWAGPLVVCAFALPMYVKVEGLKDSKKLTPAKRKVLNTQLRSDYPNNFVLIKISSQSIDQDGVLRANKKAIHLAIENCINKTGIPYDVIIDGNAVTYPGALTVPKADNTYQAVSAASVVAKEYRDSIMVAYGEVYPGYGFENHVGYGTVDHHAALKTLGVCPIHRKSYQPIKELLPVDRR